MNTKKLIGIIILVIILIVLIIQNHAPVQTNILFISVHMPLILLLVIMTGIGFVLGLLVAKFGKTKPKQ
ncbi:MAG: LapA family protein [Candidatus Latescibacteria bacterium]|nr:LapA family protein [Candidatus Latescibacterota bacterium]